MNGNKWLRSKWPRWLPRIARTRDSSSRDASNLKPEDLQQSLLKNLECPVCIEYMTPPIQLCNNGHNICGNCRPNLDKCPTCRQNILQARNYALEDLCYNLNYPCKFHDTGCNETFSGKNIKEHQAVCHHGTHTCPLDIIPDLHCEWKGKYKELVTHLESVHEDRVCSDTKFLSPETNSTSLILLLYDEIFLYYKCCRDGKCYCVVLLFGTSAEACNYKYKTKLHAHNKIEKMSQVHLVRSIAEEFDAIFRSGHCVRLDEEVVENYVEDGVLQLQVEINFARIVETEGVACKVTRRSGFRPMFSDSTRWPWCNWH